MGWMPSWVKVRMQLNVLFVTTALEPALQLTALPLSKNETVPALIALCGLVSTVAVMVAGPDALGGVRVTEVAAGETAVVVALAAWPEVVTVILQPPLNE